MSESMWEANVVQISDTSVQWSMCDDIPDHLIKGLQFTLSGEDFLVFNILLNSIYSIYKMDVYIM